jgi:hypothetical protein
VCYPLGRFSCLQGPSGQCVSGLIPQPPRLSTHRVSRCNKSLPFLTHREVPQKLVTMPVNLNPSFTHTKSKQLVIDLPLRWKWGRRRDLIVCRQTPCFARGSKLKRGNQRSSFFHDLRPRNKATRYAGGRLLKDFLVISLQRNSVLSARNQGCPVYYSIKFLIKVISLSSSE